MDNRISLLQSIIKIFGVEPRLCENRSLFKMSSKPRFQRSPLNRNEQMGKGIRFQNPLYSLTTPKPQRTLQHSPHPSTPFPPLLPISTQISLTNPHQSPPIPTYSKHPSNHKPTHNCATPPPRSQHRGTTRFRRAGRCGAAVCWRTSRTSRISCIRRTRSIRRGRVCISVVMT